jgi:Fe2+ or Zn2+ uptake regulation protein
MPETETVHDLRKARLELTRQRAELAKILAGPFEQQKTLQVAHAFEQIQKTIEAIDAAIRDEVERSTWPLGSSVSDDH